MEYVVLKMALSLAAVLGLMFLVLYGMKRFVNGGKMDTPNAVNVELLGMRNFHQKRSVYVLRIMDKVLIVGATDTSLQTLSEINDAEELKKLDLLTAESEKSNSKSGWLPWVRSEDESPRMPFAGFLSKALNEVKKNA